MERETLDIGQQPSADDGPLRRLLDDGRRRTAVVLAALAVLGVGSFVVSTGGDEPSGTRAPEARRAQPTPYPGNNMSTLAAGTYRLEPSDLEEHPTATVTLPASWNAWEGPNKFDGLEPGGTDNDELYLASRWYVGLLVLEVDAVASRPCRTPDSGIPLTPTTLLRALLEAPGTRVVRGPRRTAAFGRTATYLRIVPTRACRAGSHLLRAGAIGEVGGSEPGTPIDLWVVDVGGYPMLVHVVEDGAPRAARRELRSAVASIRFQLPR